MNKYFFSLVLFLCSFFCFSQQNKIDSLRTLLKRLNPVPSIEFVPTIEAKNAKKCNDTTYINVLNALAWELRKSSPDTAIILSTEALNLSLTGFKSEEMSSSLKRIRERDIAKSYHQLGVFNYLKGSYPLSLDYYFKALKIRESLNDKGGISITNGNIGVIYRNQGNYPQALNYYFKALKMDEESGHKNGVSRQLTNIGNIYGNEGDYPKALNYFLKALKMEEELGNKNEFAVVLGNIGAVYYSQATYPKALGYYFKALKMVEELGDKSGIARYLGNIGLVYEQQASASESLRDLTGSDSLNKKALNYYFRALQMAEEFGDKNGIAQHLGNIGYVYKKINRYHEAEDYLQRALALSTEINALNLVKEQHQSLSALYEQTHQAAKSLEHYKKYIEAKDSLFNEENTKKTVRSEMNFEFEKKQAIEKAEQEKQNEITQQEKQKQKIILILVSCFLLLVAVFASFMFNRWRITQKQKQVIEKQKEKIVDSITYAQLIQQSILMEESEMQKFLPECFIYFQPKDIVSGDFYWCTKINEKILIAAVDCTGHGVPGAFMSMIGNTLLNQIVNEKQITMPSEILKLLNLEVIESLHQTKDGALSRDGMAIALCSIDYKNNQLEYAGAENPLYMVSDNEITIINADRHGIGSGGLMAKKNNSSTTEYTNHIVPIKKDMSIFLFTDGYMDQFGGNERKKFGIQKFKELLLTNQHLSMQGQKEIIAKAHQAWKKGTAQIDDILVIGVRI
jgi:serine phosphatase RsbU (regulator of sigma subunit)